MRTLFVFLLVVAQFIAGCDPPAKTANEAAILRVEIDILRTRQPATVEDAADLLIAALPDDSKEAFASTAESDLIQYHMGLGLVIRNEFGLWSGNRNLIADSGKRHPDDVSGVIIRRAWEKVRRD